ncbi:hypothetical protein H1P_1920009 [Hyella patelloides LEGE 07179]|uniref:Uncharacterized protein n=1 Tax=Hyella patelloides LEGE 07179 TaxID=945734 RepID=A0A563VPA1_9CYAN|nr:SdrD B-like domain-containing protein [Hyella patelloides]VEP13298.1 hypothetical protein H1P_1920009 [Hyella patelloides LEGE 07179]
MLLSTPIPGATDAFSGTVVSADGDTTSDNISTDPINSNLTGGLEAGDLVTFAITVENLGGSTKGAFDVVIEDDLPAGFQIPTTTEGLNLQVNDGNGNTVSYTELTGSDPDIDDGLLDGGIRLDDDNTNNLGSIDGYELDSSGNQTNPGSNIAMITFDLEVSDNAPYLDVTSIENTATLDSYTNSEGGENFTTEVDTEGNTDTATVEVATPTATKSIATTSEAHTSEDRDGTTNNNNSTTGRRQVSIGEIVRYRLVANVPEGTANNFQLQDALPKGLLFLDDQTATAAFVSDEAPITSVTTTTSFAQPLSLGLGNFADFASISGDPNEALWVQGISDSGVTPSFVLPDSNVGNNKTIGTGNSGTPDPDNYNAATDVFFKFGDINNPDRDDDDEYVIVEFNALIANDLTDDNGNVDDNNSSNSRTNRFDVNVGTGTNFNTQNELAVSNAIYNRIVEPDITLLKEVGADGNSLSTSPFLADSGNTVYFGLTFDNTGSINTQSTAFEVTLTDQVPDGLTLVGIESIDWDNGDGSGGSGQSTGITSNTSIDVGDMVITPTFETGTGAISVDVDQMPTDGEITVLYTATVDGDVNPDELLTNTADIVYSSLPGTGTTSNPTGSDIPGTSGTTTGERNEDSATNSANDHSASSSANVQIDPLEPVKSLVATSESHTSDDDVAIGEIVRYRLAVAIPEGVTNNFQITDNLPDGLLYLGNPKLAFVADETGIDSSTISGSGLDITGTAATTPTFDLTTGVTSAIGGDSTFTSGEDVIFSLGNLTNNDRDDDDDEYVVIEFNALVENISSNQTATDVLSNDFTVTATDVTDRTSNAVTVDIVEPVITDVLKEASSTTADAGDTLTYTITFSNTGNATAFDVNLIDNIPAELENFSFDINNVTLIDVDNSTTLTGAAAGAAINTGTSNDLDLIVDEIPVNGSVTVQYTADVINGVSPDGTIDNTTNLTYTSLDGTGTASNPTGSDNTSATSGDADGERNGSGGTNDYTDNSSEQVTIEPLAPVKSLVETSESHTSDDDIAIGEIVRYRLAVAIPEGVTNNFQITDNLPDGLLYLNDGTTKVGFISDETGIASSNTSINSIPDINITPETSIVAPDADAVLISGVIADAGSDGSFASGEDVIFSLSNLTNSDNDADSEYVVIEFNALVENISSNQTAEDVLSNDFTVTATDTTDRTSNPVTVDIVEPVITDVLKEVSSDTADAGDTLTYTVTFSNDGNADAFDVNIFDTLPSGLDNLTVTSTTIFNDSITPQDVTSSFTIDTTSSSSSTNGTLDDSDNADVLDIDINRLNVGYSVEVTYTATVVDDIVVGSTVDNTVDVTYTSLDGTGAASNPTGSDNTSATSGDADGERNGSGGTNDYADNSSKQVTINNYSIGSTIFGDTNNNGTQDTGESGIADVTVNLIGGGADGLISTTGDNTSFTTTTDGNGDYFFTDLPPGEYQVVIPVSNFDTLDGALKDTTVSSINTDILDNQQDGDDNGIQTGGASTQVESPVITLSAGNEPTTTETEQGENQDDGTNLLDSNGDMTVDFGFVQPASIGNLVFLDDNGNGIKDSGESGVDGVTVTLVSGGADGVIGTGDDDTTVTTTTTNGGGYSFTDLIPGVEYQVSFDTSALTPDYQFTTTDAGSDDAIDSDANTSGATPIVTLTPGENNDSIDAGIYELASIGDTVFYDTDKNGIQALDGSELGVDGVTVTLVSGGADGVIGTGDDDTTVNTTTTNGGDYSFTDLIPGVEYQVSFDKTTLPTDYQFTTTDAGSDDDLDSDADASGETPVVVLTSGEDRDNIDAGIIPKNVLDGTDSPDDLDGTSLDDLITGGKGEDTLTGGAGEDCYYFNETSDGVDTIIDFVPAEDQIDLSNILTNEVTNYTSGDPFVQGYVELTEFTNPISGITSTIVQIDFDAGDESNPATDLFHKDVVVLQGVALSSLDSSRDFII